MIPRSITLRGFLCYKDEQVIALDDSDLWVFAGRNGSGKSAIFDAITFALFKAHRGGKQEAASLIHDEASELAVSFEFDLGAERYRIKRTVPRRGSPERGVYRLQWQPDRPEHWPAVPDTQSEDGLKRWVHEHIGLTYETFTASVLLLQGRSECLLGAQPKARFEIIAGIVDLDSYRALHKKAEARRLQHKGQAEALRNQLQALPVIEPERIEQAEDQLAEAEQARAAAEAQWKQLVGLEAQAATWLDLVGRRARATETCARARQLLADSEAIARDWARLQELEAVLPAVREAIARREAIAQFEAQERSAEDHRQAFSRKLDLITSLVDDNRRHLETIVAEIGRDEARVRAILERQAALAAPIQRAKHARTQAEEVRQLETVLASYPADLATRVAALDQEQHGRAAWKAALPALTRLARERGRLAEAQGRRLAAERAIEAGTLALSRAETALAGRRAEETAARQAESGARDRMTATATTWRAAEDCLQQFTTLDGATTCDRCGQELSPAHFAAEVARLLEQRDRAAQLAREADRAHRAAQGRLDAAGAAQAQAQRAVHDAEKALESARRDRAQAVRDADHHAAACLDAYQGLEESFRVRVAAEMPEDWGATTFPEPADLAEGRRLAAGLDALQSRLKAERNRLAAMEADRTRLEQARRTLSAVGLEPGDEEAESEHAALQQERAALGRCLKGHASAKGLAEQTVAKLDEHARDLGGHLGAAEKGLASARAHGEALRAEATRARATAPEAWRAALDAATEADLSAWDKQRRTLADRGLERFAAELPQAQQRLEQAQAERDDTERQIEALPEEARRPPEEIAPLTAQADAVRQQAETARQAKHDELNALRRDRDQRRDVQDKARTAEGELAVAETLARLLGPRGLQRDLIRDAERGIVALANPILREVSGGELELQLLEVGDDEPDHALQLGVIERVHGRTGTRGVEYLSGSQKFRVAVSLALAIGQYARGSQERPIESVIIDEGFGSLDREGRDEMIAQLNALRGRLSRVILVSHQDEFAEAFRDGYRFEVVDGSTVARPFHR